MNPYVNHTNPCKKLFIHWVLCLEQVEQLYPKPNHLLHLQISSNFYESFALKMFQLNSCSEHSKS